MVPVVQKHVLVKASGLRVGDVLELKLQLHQTWVCAPQVVAGSTVGCNIRKDALRRQDWVLTFVDVGGVVVIRVLLYVSIPPTMQVRLCSALLGGEGQVAVEPGVITRFFFDRRELL